MQLVRQMAAAPQPLLWQAPAVKRRPLTDAPEALPPEARARLREWARSHLPWGDQRIGRSWGECRDWHLSRGVLRADWEAAFRNWLRKEVQFQAQDGPQRGRNRADRLGGGITHRSPVWGPSRLSEGMGEVIDLFKGARGE